MKNTFPLKEEEKQLMLSYFTHPRSFILLVQDYHKNKPAKKERKYSQKLQREYWLLKNTEYVVMRLDEIDKQKKLMQQKQEGAQN